MDFFFFFFWKLKNIKIPIPGVFLIREAGGKAPSSGSSWLTYARPSAHPGRLWLRKKGHQDWGEGAGKEGGSVVE